MGGAWISASGWSRDYPDALPEAILALPGADGMDAERAAWLARHIADAALAGRDLERPANQGASAQAADASIAKLHDLCERLAAHLETLRRPAVEALAQEGTSVATLSMLVREAQEAARCAYGGTDAPPQHKGRRRAVEAAEVTDACAHVFEQVTGRRPTFTRDPVTHAVRGPWIEFLTAAFAACYIVASPESQAAAYMEKNRPREAD